MIDNSIVDEILSTAAESRRLTSLIFEITNKCNLDCVHCYLGDKRNEKLECIPLEKIVDVLKEAKKIGVFDIALTGGEVFTYKYWKELFAIIKNQGFNLVIFTNAVNLCEKDISYMKRIGVNTLKISCYGMNKETYEATTQVSGSYEKYKENIRLLNKYGINHFFSNIVLSTNQNDYKEMIEKNGTKSMELYIINDIQHSGNPIQYRPSEKIWNECHYEMMKNAKLDSDFWNDPSQYICTAGMARLTILPNGDVIPCVNLRIPVGNIYSDSLHQIWEGSKLAKVLQSFLVGKFEKCFNCPNKRYLTYVCPGSNYNDTGDYYLPSEFKCHLCEKNKEVIEGSINNKMN